MNKRKYLLKDKNGSATILDAIISIGIAVTFFIVFLYYTNALYAIQDEPGVDLEVKSVGLMETLINSPGQTNSLYPEWQDEEEFDILKVLGLGTSQTIQYGTLRINDNNETTILSSYPDSNSIGIGKTCFLAGTQIVMADESYKNIEDIEVGDLIKSYDEKSNEIVDKQVTHVFHHTPDEMGGYYLVINNQLRVTPNHRFYVEGDWVYADELSIGDSLFYPSTDYAVFSIEKIFERTYTYNFEVEGYHNYFVAMEPTSVLVHNGELIVRANPLDPPEGSAPCTITFTCEVTNGMAPFTYEWDFGDGGEIEVENNINERIHSYSHEYTEEGTYDVNLVITDDNEVNTGWVIFSDIPIHDGPIATFTWFDADGPFGSTEICCNASDSSYSGPSATYKWSDNGNLIETIVDDPIWSYDLLNEEIHNIELELIDGFFINSDTHTEQVKANSLTTPFVIDSKPWVLTGKDIYPDSDNDTFQSYSAGYYVKYTIPNGAPSDSPVRIFEVKEKTNTEQPVIDIQKIKDLTSGRYNVLYSDIKSALGLVSDRVLYNFDIKITIYNENGGEDELFFGASDDNTIAKASTTRQVLVYDPPTAEEGDMNVANWVIGSHPKYKQAEITISIFIGGTPPPEYIK